MLRRLRRRFRSSNSIRSRTSGRRLAMESLEDRRLLAAYLNAGKLVVLGTGNPDQLSGDLLSHGAGRDRIYLNGRYVGTR